MLIKFFVDILTTEWGLFSCGLKVVELRWSKSLMFISILFIICKNLIFVIALSIGLSLLGDLASERNDLIHGYWDKINGKLDKQNDMKFCNEEIFDEFSKT